MTSVISTYPPRSRLPDPARYVMLTYTTPDGYSAPFPWRFNKQTQAIDLEFINGFDTSIGPSERAMFIRGHSLHASHNVLRLGANFITWMETYDLTGNGAADIGSVVMTENPIVLSANALSPIQSPNAGMTNSSTVPISFESSAGTLASSYLKTLIFLKPLVIRYTVAGDTQYRYFTNNFEGDT